MGNKISGKNIPDGKKIAFICVSCGAKNLRDGTAILNKAKQTKPAEPIQAKTEAIQPKEELKKDEPETKKSGFGFFCF